MFGKRLREMRMARGYTQQVMAVPLGVSLRVYQNYEQGTRRPSYETLVNIARFLRVTTDYLLGASDEAPADAC